MNVFKYALEVETVELFMKMSPDALTTLAIGTQSFRVQSSDSLLDVFELTGEYGDQSLRRAVAHDVVALEDGTAAKAVD